MSTISKLLGHPKGYVGVDDGKSLFDQVIKGPHSVVILDETEKLVPIEELLVDELDERLQNDHEARYRHCLPSVRLMQKKGVADSDIEAAFNIRLKPEDRHE